MSNLEPASFRVALHILTDFPAAVLTTHSMCHDADRPPLLRYQLGTTRYLRDTLHLRELCAPNENSVAASSGAAVTELLALPSSARFARATYDASANYLQGGNMSGAALYAAAPWLKIVLVFREVRATGKSVQSHQLHARP